MIRYHVNATVPFLTAIAFVGNTTRQVQVLASDGTLVDAGVENAIASDPGDSAELDMNLATESALPGTIREDQDPHRQRRETIQVGIPGTDKYQVFVVRTIELG